MSLTAKSTDKPAGPLERSLIERSKHEPEIRLSRGEIGELFSEIGDPALLGLLATSRNGTPICKVGNALLVIDLPPVRMLAAQAPAVAPADDRVAALEAQVGELKGGMAQILALLQAKA